MGKTKERYETPDIEALEGNLFLVEAVASVKEQNMEGGDEGGTGVEESLD